MVGNGMGVFIESEEFDCRTQVGIYTSFSSQKCQKIAGKGIYGFEKSAFRMRD